MTATAEIFTRVRLRAFLLLSTALAGSAAYAQTVPVPAAAPATATPVAPVNDARTIRSLNVSGSQRIEPDTVRSYIQLRAGQTYTKADLDQALRDLFATELFQDVQIRDDNGALTIEVKENPVINRVLFEGNKRLKEDKLTPEIKLAARQIFTPSKVRADVARIIELYRRQGRYGATVDPQKIMLDQNRVDVVYVINEGPKSKVRAINIIGNHVFKDAVLRAQMATRVTSLKHFLSSATTYDADRMAYDQQKLRQFYLTEGYADFKVDSAVAELTPDRKDFIITYVVEEGPRYKYGDVTVESDLHDLKPEVFKPVVGVKKGDWFNAKADEDIIDNMTKRAGFFGYAFADVNVDVHPHADSRTMDVIFKVGETPRVYVERIDIAGNTLTQDKVIRREFRLTEGDAFNTAAVKRSEERIKSLGFFQEKFEIEQKKGSADDRVILAANVEDKPTGQLELSAGYSSLEKLTFSASIAQRNFRGAGQTLQLSGSVSTYSKQVDIGFSEPYAFNKNIAIGFDVFRRDITSFNYVGTTRNTTYRTSSTGFQFRAGLPLTEFWSLALRYGFRTENVSLDESTYYLPDANGVPQCSVLLAGRYLCDAIGNRTISDLGFSLVRSTLDNGIHPGHGLRFLLNADLAGPGGSVRYLKTTAEFAKYFTLKKGFIFSARAEGGAVFPLRSNATTDPVQLTDRFFLGEPQFAGFDIRGIGPKVVRNYLGVSGATAAQFVGDAYELYDGNKTLLSTLVGTPGNPVSQVGAATYTTPTDPNNPTPYSSTTYDALGGRYYYKGRLELEIPLGSGAKELGIRPSIFTDVGAVWGVRTPQLITVPASSPGTNYFAYTDTDGSTKYYNYYASLGKTNTGLQIYQVPSTASTTYNGSSVAGATTTCASGYSPNQVAPNDASCTGTTIANSTSNLKNRAIPPFTEQFLGNTPRPRLSIGFGINWNSPFGPFRIDVAKALLKSEGDQTKLFTFNVGTAF